MRTPPTKVSAYTSSPIPPSPPTSYFDEEDLEYDDSQLEASKVRSPKAIKRSNESNVLNNLYRPSKRITSCTSLNNISEPLFKNIKYYTSKKLRSSSSSSTPTPTGSPKKRLGKLVTDTTSPSNIRQFSGNLLSLPSTPCKNPGLSFEDTPSSDYSPITPNGNIFKLHEEENDHVARQLFKTESQSTFDDEYLTKIENLTLNTEHHIFKIPEIVNKILEIYHLQNSHIPHEQPPIRRNPISFEHAMLIHKNEAVASKIWEESKDITTANNNSVKCKHALFNCLTVNKLWHQISQEILLKSCYFDDDIKWLKYASLVNKRLSQDPNLRSVSVPDSFVLHKITHMKQRHFDLVTNLTSFQNLKWFEMYICPKILPNPKMFTSKLTKLVITGSKVLNDDFLNAISHNLKNLEVLDLRACELITDSSIYTISLNCPKLNLLNVGRHTRGDLISDASICSIIKNTNITTLGVAGCGITDRTIWELVINRSHDMERLSLNKCWKLTNESIPKCIRFFKKLSVLELRHCLRIDNVKPIVEYKRHQQSKKINVLIEGCEIIEKLILQEELLLDMEISKKILEDITDWCNSNSDNEW